MKLKWLEIDRFRNVAPGTRLEFDDGFNVVLGRNGTGKTTLLRFIEAITSGYFGRFSEEEFSIRAELYHQDDSMVIAVCQTQAEPPELPPEVQREGRAHRMFDWVYQVSHSGPGMQSWSLLSTPSTGTLKAREQVAVSPVSPFEKHSFSAILFTVLHSRQAHKFSELAMMSLAAGPNCRFDESTRVFERIVGATDLGAERTLVHVTESPGPPSGTIQNAVFFPRNLFFKGALASPDLNDQSLSFSSDELGFLRDVCRLIGAESASMRLDRASLSGPSGQKAAVYDRPNFQLRFSSGLTISHEHLSYGQKRVLAFIYYLECIPGPVVADELVNGMHHSWIEECLSLVERRQWQAFLTSQNPLLLDYLEFASAEEAQRAFVLCELDGDTFVWRQMSDEEAERFYSAYEVGVQHVGDILRTKGLW